VNKMFLLIVAIVILAVGGVTAQVSTFSALSGSVTDAAGASLAGATVTLTNTQTNQTFNAETNDEGTYNFPRLERGRYNLRVEKSGFAPTVRENLILTVSESATADFVLQVGGVTESVTVEAGTNVVQTEKTNISQLVDERRVRELPLNGKNYLRLVQLAPGVGSTVPGQFSPNNLPINGSRPSTNNYALDGGSFNDERFDSVPGGASTFTETAPNVISTEAIQEFRIITTNADATFGRGSGGQINVVTRQGGNAFRGSAYYFLRNEVFDARDFFNFGPFFDSEGRAKTPPFRQHLYGASVGGPIRRDKHFFFGNYEGFNQRRDTTFRPRVPNAALINLVPGDLGAFFRRFYIDGGFVPPTGNPAGQFTVLPASDRTAAIAGGFNPALFDTDLTNGEAGTVLLNAAAQNDIRQQIFLIRTDHKFTDKFSASFRYQFARPEQLSSQGFYAQENRARTQSGLGQFVYNISPSQILEARLAFFQSRSGDGIEGGAIPEALAQFAFPLNGITITQSGTGTPLTSIPLQPVSTRNLQRTPQLSVLHTFARGNFTLRSGADLRDVRVDFRRGFSETPFYDFRGFFAATGIVGLNTSVTQATADSVFGTILGNNGSPNNALRHWQSFQQEYFGQVDWRVSREITLNLGLRYSHFGVYRERDNFASNLFATDALGNLQPSLSPFTNGATQNLVAPLTDDLKLYRPDRDNFQPRLGIAYDIGGRNRTVVRAAYGLFHDRVFQGQFALNVGNRPFAISSFAFSRQFRFGTTFPTSPNTPSYWVIDSNLRNPHTHRFNFAVEQKIDRDTSVTIAYVGSRSRNLIRALEPNGSGSLPTAIRPDVRFSIISYVANASEANYDSLQVIANRRFSEAIAFTAVYTLSQSKDNVSTDALLTRRNPTILNLGANPTMSGIQGTREQLVPRPLNADYGLSDFDSKHNFTVSHLIELPFGKGKRFFTQNKFANALLGDISLSGIFIFRSGEPFTITTGTDDNDDGDVTQDRARLLSGSIQDLYASGGNRTQFLLPLSEAVLRLGRITDVADPFSVIPRNSFRSPNFMTYDLSLIKRFRFTENVRLQLEANGFNIFNRVNFAAPVSVLTSPEFGQLQRTRVGANPRQFQFGVKMNF